MAARLYRGMQRVPMILGTAPFYPTVIAFGACVMSALLMGMFYPEQFNVLNAVLAFALYAVWVRNMCHEDEHGLSNWWLDRITDGFMPALPGKWGALRRLVPARVRSSAIKASGE